MAKNMLHPGARWLFRIRGYSTMFFLFLFLYWVLIFPSAFFRKILFPELSIFWPIIISIVIFIVVVIILSEIYARMYYNRWFYEFTEHNLKLERGVIWKRYSNVPYERVQNIDIHRGVIARLLGFSSVMIQTAGYSGGAGRGHYPHTEGYIPAVSIEAAEHIRDFLMKKISKHSKSGL